MIGSIRKHSSWLWWIIAGLTIISFVFFMGSGPSRGGGGSRGGGYGSVYGHEITPDAFASARNALFLSYWQQTGEWPDKSPNFDRNGLEQQIYVRVMLMQKAKDLGIQVTTAAVVDAANEMLRAIGRNGQPVPLQQFEERVLRPEGLTALDFQNFIRSYLTIQQLVQSLGLSGALVTPQEAGMLYDREHREVSAQAVFFAASNYLAQVTATPAAVQDFYAKHLAAYREPDRVQVDYVAFEVTNFLAQSKAEWAKTNFEETVNSVYTQYGATEFASYKTPEEAKVKIREVLVHNRALGLAAQQAKDFVTPLFAMEPAKAENLAVLAKKMGLTVHTTAPFSAAYGPEEFYAPPAFTKIAFQLNADSPYSQAIQGQDTIYVIALAKQVPSSIPPLEQIRNRVTQDFQGYEALTLAQREGTNFYAKASARLAAGDSFAKASVAAGHAPVLVTPFSLSSAEVPEFSGRAEMGQIKQAAFTTPVGKLSNFVPTTEGGFVMFVQAMQPVDETKKVSELPQFLSQIRRARQNEAFNVWLQAEAGRELGGILKELSAQKTAK